MCPQCGAASVTLPRFTTRRRSQTTCTSCGARLERVLPAAWYYSLRFFTGLLAEVAALAVLGLSLFGAWPWAALVMATLLLVNLGISVFLNARTRVEYADIKDARRYQPGRWYPKVPGD